MNKFETGLEGIAIGDAYYEVQIGKGEFRSPQLEFYGPDGKLGSWIVVNTNNEPVIWAVPKFKYTLGSMKRFGNFRMPDCPATGNGLVTYQMVSLTGSNQPPDSSCLFHQNSF